VNNRAESEDTSRTLRLLELIHQDGGLTQRELSRRMGIALGLVNLSLKRLMRLELVKVQHLSARRVMYLLTPRGMTEKGRLSTRYLTDSFSMYRAARRAFLRCFAALRDGGERRVVLYGDGPLAEAAYLTLQELKLELCGVAGVGVAFLGHAPISLAEVAQGTVDRVLFAGSTGEEARCREEMTRAGLPPEALVDLSALLSEADG